MEFTKTIVKSVKHLALVHLALFSFTQLAQAQIDKSPAEIKGVKLGMSFKHEFEKFGHHNQSLLASKKDGEDVIHMSTAGHPERSQIVIVARALKYQNEGEKPIWENVKNSITKKFGHPHMKDEFSDYRLKNDPWLEYEWNSKGKKKSQGIGKTIKVLDAVSSTPTGTQQPYCALPERIIGKQFGQDFEYSMGENLRDDYSPKYVSYFNYVDNYMRVTSNGNIAEGRSYGPVLEQRTTKLRDGSDKVLYGNGCRTFFFIRGELRPSSQEVNTVFFTLMDHRTLKKQQKELQKWKADKASEMQQKINEKIEAVQKSAPEIDL